MTSSSKVSRQAQLQQVQSGLQKHYPSTSLVLGGVTYSPSDLDGLIQAALSALSATAQAKAAYAQQVQVEQNALAKVSPVLSLLKKFVIAQVGDTKEVSSTLADFGYTPRSTTKSSVTVKAEAVAKDLSTRAEHHDLGKVQKEKLSETATSPAVASGGTGGCRDCPQGVSRPQGGDAEEADR